MKDSLKVALFGSAPDTPNMGVSALFASVVAGLRDRLPGIQFVVFDNGLGSRQHNFSLWDESTISVDLLGIRAGLRVDRAENLLTIAAAASMGRLGALNRIVHAIDECDAVLDISGGDSFSDIYGIKRFNSVTRPKKIAIARRTPLILLPQTYGPFKSSRCRRVASSVARRAAACWARDLRSFEQLKSLLGQDFDTTKHHAGVDMAFGLGSTDPTSVLSVDVKNLIGKSLDDCPLVGFNVSGLIYNNPAASAKEYGIKGNYNSLVIEFLRWLLKTSRARILLIPHVMSPPGHYESDLGACREVAQTLGDFQDRLAITPSALDQSQVKWLIAKTDWFCGTRMHSTIAALSSCVATATISYSDKAKGVFECCGLGKQVFDPRSQSNSDMLQHLKASFSQRDALRETLQKNLPKVQQQLDQQLNAIALNIQGRAIKGQ